MIGVYQVVWNSLFVPTAQPARYVYVCMYVAETLRHSPVCTSYVATSPLLSPTLYLPFHSLQSADRERKTPHPTHRNNKPTSQPTHRPRPELNQSSSPQPYLSIHPSINPSIITATFHPPTLPHFPTNHPSFLCLLPNISQAGHGTLSPPPPNPFLSERAERTTTGFTFAYPTLD